MEKEQAAEKAAAYVEGYRQCLNDVMLEGVETAQRIAQSETLQETLEAAYKGE